MKGQKCEVCRGVHDTTDCPVMPQKQVGYMGNSNQASNNAFGNTYHPIWKSHPNFSWTSGGNPSGFQSYQSQPTGGNVGASSSDSDKKIEVIEEILANQTRIMQLLVTRDQETQLKLKENDTLLRNQQAAFLEY
jgi:hypothetical protein